MCAGGGRGAAPAAHVGPAARDRPAHGVPAPPPAPLRPPGQRAWRGLGAAARLRVLPGCGCCPAAAGAAVAAVSPGHGRSALPQAPPAPEEPLPLPAGRVVVRVKVLGAASPRGARVRAEHRCVSGPAGEFAGPRVSPRFGDAGRWRWRCLCWGTPGSPEVTPQGVPSDAVQTSLAVGHRGSLLQQAVVWYCSTVAVCARAALSFRDQEAVEAPGLCGAGPVNL